jgi:GT2 family glycosyltransferase
LRAVADCGYPRELLEVVGADNASGDGSEAEFLAWKEKLAAEKPPLRLQVLQTGANLGFGGGNNVGWRLGKAPFVLFLNLDTQVRPGFLGEMIEAMARHPRAGFAGCKIYFPQTRKLQHAGGRVFFNGMTDHYFNGEEDNGQADEEREVAFATGACLLARRSVLEALGGFDEDFYPAYFEEVDLCLRARRLGWTTLYVPSAMIEHHESAGLGGRQDPRFLRMLYRGRVKLVAKHWTPADFFERWLPTERWWFGTIESKEARPYQWRSYLQGLIFLARTNLRLLFSLRRLPPLPGEPILPADAFGPGELPLAKNAKD